MTAAMMTRTMAIGGRIVNSVQAIDPKAVFKLPIVAIALVANETDISDAPIIPALEAI